MTDKQIIIDGVDVSGCKYYVENNGIEAQGCYELTDLCECNNENEFCDNNPNCYYKQLKRAEQKLKEIKEIAEDFYLDGEHVKDKYLAQEILQKISECEVEQ
jgi:hypothetical protein